MIEPEVCRVCGAFIQIGSIYCKTHAEVSVEQFCPKCKDATAKEQNRGVVRGSVGVSGVPPSATSYHNSGPIFCAVCLTPVQDPLTCYHGGLEIPLSEYPFENEPKLRALLVAMWTITPLLFIAFFFGSIFIGFFFDSPRLLFVVRFSLLISVLLLVFILWNGKYGFARDRRIEFHSKGYAGHTLRYHYRHQSKHGISFENKAHLPRHKSLSPPHINDLIDDFLNKV